MMDETKEPSARAWAIADGLIRTGRGSSATAAAGFISLFARGGQRYWVSFDGHRVLRGRTLESADELQSGFIEAMERAGAAPDSPRDR